jgi:hypothetical protein
MPTRRKKFRQSNNELLKTFNASPFHTMPITRLLTYNASPLLLTKKKT